MCGSTVSGVRQLYVLGNKGYHEEDTPDFTGDKIDMVQATQRCSTKVTSSLVCPARAYASSTGMGTRSLQRTQACVQTALSDRLSVHVFMACRSSYWTRWMGRS